jgi:hypothetical protein
MNLQNPLKILTIFLYLHTQRAKQTGDNLLQEEREAASQLQPFTYSYNNSGLFLVVLTENRCTPNTDDVTVTSQKRSQSHSTKAIPIDFLLFSTYLSFCWTLPLKYLWKSFLLQSEVIPWGKAKRWQALLKIDQEKGANILDSLGKRKSVGGTKLSSWNFL